MIIILIVIMKMIVRMKMIMIIILINLYDTRFMELYTEVSDASDIGYEIVTIERSIYGSRLKDRRMGAIRPIPVGPVDQEIFNVPNSHIHAYAGASGRGGDLF